LTNLVHYWFDSAELSQANPVSTVA
jgi:hypothetical protein